ncbi:MAG: succinylglutamate desuccinylase/aspartoacylase family protein [Candidatus Falkowbacteria bacterium]
MKYDETIIKISGAKPGKTLAVFAGVHGNETTGIKALKQVVKNIKIDAGTVYFVLANPEAIGKNVRQVDKNLNRCFFLGNKGRTAEDKRARELMKLLDKCEALLDLHASNNPNSIPFIICEKHAFQAASIFDFKIVSHGWDAFEPGATDGYMNTQRKIALCLECGSVHDNNEPLAVKSIMQFLKFFGAIKDATVKYNHKKQKMIKIVKAGYKKSEQLAFAKNYNDFAKLKPGEIYATDGPNKYKAGTNQCIIFPNINKKIGEEIFLIGRTM